MKSRAVFILPPYSSDIDSAEKPSWGIVRVPPIGLFSIGSYLQSKGHDIKIIDCREIINTYKTREYIPILLKAIDEFKPDIIGINVLTALFDETKVISRELKKRFPTCIIILGGPHPSVEPVLTLQQNHYADAICVGAGEEVCLDILDGQDMGNTQGLMHRNHIDKFEKRDAVLDIDKYPFPDYSLANPSFYTDFTIYTIIGWGFKGLGELTSRSCPYSCKFCASDWSKPVRYHSPEYVIELAKYLSAYDVDVLGFWDDSIVTKKDRLYAICEGFIQSGLFYPHGRLRWSAGVRANQIQPDILKMMKSAGCYGIGIGVESGSDRMLKVMNKKTTVEMNKRACAYVNEAGLFLATSFMVGIPGETETEMNETLAFMQDIKRDKNPAAIGVGCFRPLPGSPFYNEFISSNVLTKEHIDWSNLGDFSIKAKDMFCDVPRGKFEEIFDQAWNIANIDTWSVVHEDNLSKYPELIKAIAAKTRIKIAKDGNYETSAHTPYNISSPLIALQSRAFHLYIHLPYKLRQLIRAAVKELIKKKYFTWLWKY